MQTLSKGFKKPESGDDGSVWFPAMEDNIQQLNDHTHDGANSQKLSATSAESYLQSPAMAWTDTGDGTGTFRSLVTMPVLLTAAGLTFDHINIGLRSAGGQF